MAATNPQHRFLSGPLASSGGGAGTRAAHLDPELAGSGEVLANEPPLHQIGMGSEPLPGSRDKARAEPSPRRCDKAPLPSDSQHPHHAPSCSFAGRLSLDTPDLSRPERLCHLLGGLSCERALCFFIAQPFLGIRAKRRRPHGYSPCVVPVFQISHRFFRLGS